MNLVAKSSTLSLNSDKEEILEKKFGPKINLIYNSNSIVCANNENNIYTGISERKNNDKFHLKILKEKSQLDTTFSKKRNSILFPFTVPSSVVSVVSVLKNKKKIFKFKQIIFHNLFLEKLYFIICF